MAPPPPPSHSLIHFFFLFVTQLAYYTPSSHAASGTGGQWHLLLKSIGIASMHMQLLHNDRVITFDRTDFGVSPLPLANGKCRKSPLDPSVKIDCTAHSVEYDVLTNTFRPLMLQTNVWCSSGAVLPDGELVQTGGFRDGYRVVRIFKPCGGRHACDWQEIGAQLLRRRWYATNHVLPDGRMIIIGGRAQPNYEFYPKSVDKNLYGLPFLVETNDPRAENNLYPFVFLYKDGHLFMFANNRAVMLDYFKNIVVKRYPVIPGGEPRSYPSTGSAVLLPLKGGDPVYEVLVCGGAPFGSFRSALKGRFFGALKTCARMNIDQPNPKWVMEAMPMARIMGDMVMMPDGNVMIINGASAGTAGWEIGRNPVLTPVIYKPDAPLGSRFEVQNPTTVPRMYHSTAILLRDCRILVGGSNPHAYYNFTNVLYPTELSVEAFSPPYLDSSLANRRPRILFPDSNKVKLKYGQVFLMRFAVRGMVDRTAIEVAMIPPSFNTHSFSQSQRMLQLDIEKIDVVRMPLPMYQIQVKAPASATLAPPGYYMFFVVYKHIPSEGIWIQM